jgi:hypothetical protein
MDVTDIRSELEEDLAWRLDEIRHLRNSLLGEIDREQWPAVAMRSILVLQYAHLEGFARNAFAIYVTAVNRQTLSSRELHPHLFASALIEEFDAVRRGAGGDQESEDGRLMRRAKSQVQFVQRLRTLNDGVCSINVESAVSMEMNFGQDVLRRTLYRLGIPETSIDRTYYDALEFVRRTRNDIAHGNRRDRIMSGEFEANVRKCEGFMNELIRLITRAAAEDMYRQGSNNAA